jgi:hypothetical protein
MTTQRFALEPNGPLRLELTWSAAQQAYQVALDGKTVGEVPTRELSKGAALQLPDGSRLQVRGTETDPELELTHNGKPLRNPTNWPPLVKNAGMVLLGLGLLCLLTGLATLSGSPAAAAAPSWILGALGVLGDGAGAVGLGAAYFACAYFALQRQQAAMWAAGALMLVDTALTVGAALQAGQPFVGGLLARLVVLAAMVRGLQAVRGIKRAAAAAGVSLASSA